MSALEQTVIALETWDVIIDVVNTFCQFPSGKMIKIVFFHMDKGAVHIL